MQEIKSSSSSHNKETISSTSKNHPHSEDHKAFYALDIWEKNYKTDPLFGNSLDELVEILRVENQKPSSSFEQQTSDWAKIVARCSDTIQGYCLENFFEALSSFHKKDFSNIDELVDLAIITIHKHATIEDLEKSFLKNASSFKWFLEKEHKNLIRKLIIETPTFKEPPVWDAKRFSFLKDPWLLESAQYVCTNKQSLSPLWIAWLENLPMEIRAYWEAKYLKVCSPLSFDEIELKIQKAIDALQAKEAKNVSYFKIELFYDLIQVNRSLGSRIKMATAYIGLVSVWSEPGLNVKALEQAKISIPERKLDDFLWAARALVLVGEYDEAKTLLGRVKELAISESKRRRASNIQVFQDFLAEVAHVQSTRIYYEAGQLKEAVDTNLDAIKNVKASPTWINRLYWYLGLFYFVQNDFIKAKDVWSVLLPRLSSFDSLKPGLLFWLSRVHEKLKDSSRSKFYLDTLNAEFPLSFYIAVNLVDTLGQKKHSQDIFLKDFFARFIQLQENFDLQHVANEEIYLARPDLRELFLKYKFSVEIKYSKWAGSYLKAIRKLLLGNFEKDPRLKIFLTRLEYESGSYASAFASIQNIMSGQKDFIEKYPEQMFLLFPMPYFRIAKEVAFRNQVPMEWLYGVSRQESSFRTQVVSPAGAVGLMQLMPATAWMLAQGGELGDEKIESYSKAHDELLKPEVNLEAGARLLSRLSRKYGANEAAVFASYNAGEYVVDRWLNKRANEDPIFWIEMIPFQETKGYVRSVMRNVFVYRTMIEYDSRKR